MVLPPASGSAPEPKPTFRVPRGKLKPSERREDVRRRASYAKIVASMRETGINLVPIFVGKPDADGERTVVDGNSRLFAAEECDIDELLAIEVEEDLDEAGQIILGSTTNSVRRTMKPEELGLKAQRLMELLDITQEEAARLLHMSAAALSRALTSLLLPEKHQARGARLENSTRCLIAAIKDSAVQDRAMEFASTPKPNGRLPSRDEVAGYVKRLNKEGSPGRKARPREEIEGGRTSSIACLSVWGDLKDPMTLAKDLAALATLVEANAKHGLKAVIEILRNKDRPGGSATSLVPA